MNGFDWGRLGVALGELITMLLRRYATNDPAEAAERMVDAMKAQDRVAAASKRRHAKRRAKR